MNTPAHVLIGAAAGARRGDWRAALAGGLGGLAPDLPLYLLSAWAMVAQGISASEVFGTLYYSAAWQRVFAVDHAVLLWGGLLALALWRGCSVATAFGLGGTLHVVADLLTHREDARAHFQPLTDWVFRSPVSYWNPAHHGEWIAALEIALCLALAIWLWRRFTGRGARVAVLTLCAAQLSPGLVWGVLLA